MTNNKINVKMYQYPEYDIIVHIFNHPKFGEIRALMIKGDPWFVAEDIAAVFDMFPAAIRRCVSPEHFQFFKNDEITALHTGDDGVHLMALYGLDDFLDFCAKVYPEKKQEFERWICSETFPILCDSVLPGSEEEDETDEDADVTMMLYTFRHPQFGDIRALVLQGEPHFVFEDIAKALKALEVELKRIKVSISDIMDTPKIQTDEEIFLLLSEDATDSLFASCMQGASPDTKKFICWIEGSLLPELLKQHAADAETAKQKIQTKDE